MPDAAFERGVLNALSHLTEAVRIIERRLTSGEYDDSGLWQVDDAVRHLERLIDWPLLCDNCGKTMAEHDALAHCWGPESKTFTSSDALIDGSDHAD